MFVEDKDKHLPSDLCDTFLSLCRDESLPSWAIGNSPVEEIRKGAKGGLPAKPRLWMRRGLALVMPQLQDNYLVIGALISDDLLLDDFGDLEVWDADSGESFVVPVPPKLPAFATEIVWEMRKENLL